MKIIDKKDCRRVEGGAISPIITGFLWGVGNYLAILAVQSSFNYFWSKKESEDTTNKEETKNAKGESQS